MEFYASCSCVQCLSFLLQALMFVEKHIIIRNDVVNLSLYYGIMVDGGEGGCCANRIQAMDRLGSSQAGGIHGR